MNIVVTNTKPCKIYFWKRFARTVNHLTVGDTAKSARIRSRHNKRDCYSRFFCHFITSALKTAITVQAALPIARRDWSDTTDETCDFYPVSRPPPPPILLNRTTTVHATRLFHCNGRLQLRQILWPKNKKKKTDHIYLTSTNYEFGQPWCV